eukprot:COSAG06_NODE_2002_length_7845_cov_2.590991_1_plen_1045_part_00
MLRTPQPPPERKFRLDRNLDPDQLRHVNAMSTGRTPGLTLLGSNELEPSTARVPTQYEIVSMEESSFVFDTKSSRFADVRADNWREQLSGPVRSPQPPGSPSNSAVLKHTGSRNRRNMHGKLKTAKHATSPHDDPLAALGKPDDTFRWPEKLGGAALPKPRPKDPALEGRLDLPNVPDSVGSQRHRRLVRDGAPKAGAVVMYSPASKAERDLWSEKGGKGWPKLARLKRFRVEPGVDGEKATGKAAIELLLDATVIDTVDMASLTAEPQPRWAMRDAAVAAALAAAPRHPGWNPAMEAKKQAAAFEAGFAEHTGMDMAKEDQAWKAELAAREWEEAVFGMEEDDWERTCAEGWEATVLMPEREKAEAEAAQAAKLAAEDAARLKTEEEAAAKAAALDEKHRQTDEFINWRDSYEEKKRLQQLAEEEARALARAKAKAIARVDGKKEQGKISATEHERLHGEIQAAPDRETVKEILAAMEAKIADEEELARVKKEARAVVDEKERKRKVSAAEKEQLRSEIEAAPDRETVEGILAAMEARLKEEARLRRLREKEAMERILREQEEVILTPEQIKSNERIKAHKAKMKLKKAAAVKAQQEEEARVAAALEAFNEHQAKLQSKPAKSQQMKNKRQAAAERKKNGASDEDAETEAVEPGSASNDDEDDESDADDNATERAAQSPDALAMLRTSFEAMDRDGGGSLDREEINTLLLSLGRRVEESQLDEIMAQIDEDCSGHVDFEEFSQFFTEHAGAAHRAGRRKTMIPKAAPDTDSDSESDSEILQRLDEEEEEPEPNSDAQQLDTVPELGSVDAGAGAAAEVVPDLDSSGGEGDAVNPSGDSAGDAAAAAPVEPDDDAAVEMVAPTSPAAAEVEEEEEEEEPGTETEQGGGDGGGAAAAAVTIEVTPLLDSLKPAVVPQEEAEEHVAELVAEEPHLLAAAAAAQLPPDDDEDATTPPAEVVAEELHIGPTLHQQMYPLGGPIDAPESSDEKERARVAVPMVAAERGGEDEAPAEEVEEVAEAMGEEGTSEEGGGGKKVKVSRKVRLG